VLSSPRIGAVPPKPLNSRRKATLSPRLAAGALALLLLSGGGSACRKEGNAAPRRIFFITVDTLRADHLGAYGYRRQTSPYLDQLAKRSVVFDWAVVQWPKTGPSFASIFTGKYPHSTGLTHQAAITIPDAYLTLPQFLKNQGFTNVAVNANGVLNADLGWNRGFDEYLETRTAFKQAADTPQDYRNTMNARRVNELALPLLEKHRGDDRLFAWIHYCDPHTPYLLPPGVDNPFLADSAAADPTPVDFTTGEGVQIGDHTQLGFYTAQYDANVMVVDQAVAALMGKLEELRLLDDALVIFTADHGESLGEHGYFLGHGRLPYNPTARVPLFLWRKGIAPGRVARPVELLDLYPTLNALAAPAKQVAGLEGRSLRPFLDGKTPPDGAFTYAFSAAGGGSPLTHFRTVQDERWKLVFHPPLPTKKGDRPALWELYDLDADPLEAKNVFQDGDSQARRLNVALRDWMGDRLWIRPPKGFVQAHSEETLKALKALGYIH
jgi:arylsulfatase